MNGYEQFRGYTTEFEGVTLASIRLDSVASKGRMPIMRHPRKTANGSALGSRSGDQLVSLFNTARINVGALYRIKKKSGSLENIDRALPPLKQPPAVSVQRKQTLSKAPITRDTDTGKRFLVDPLSSFTTHPLSTARF